MTRDVTDMAGRVVALCGGIGGAKLALGFSRIVPPDRLSIIVNTGDDFHHFGLFVCPDLDTVTYTLAGRANAETGWGRADESWRFMAAVEELGGETWFRLGDTDLATSAVRTERLSRGHRLTEVTRDIAQALGVEASILPATDDRLATVVDTDRGEFPFQHYFVGERCRPVVRDIRYKGADEARPTAETLDAIDSPDLAAVIICPSNPYLSVDPILSLRGLRERLAGIAAPVVAVSPIVGGKAIKGPLDKMMTELGLDAGLQTIADHYAGFLDILVIDEQDAGASVTGPSIHVAQTVMRTLEDRISLARNVLEIAMAHCQRVRR